MMADSWLLLRNFKQSAEQELSAAKREVVKLQDHIATRQALVRRLPEVDKPPCIARSYADRFGGVNSA